MHFQHSPTIINDFRLTGIRNWQINIFNVDRVYKYALCVCVIRRQFFWIKESWRQINFKSLFLNNKVLSISIDKKNVFELLRTLGWIKWQLNVMFNEMEYDDAKWKQKRYFNACVWLSRKYSKMMCGSKMKDKPCLTTLFKYLFRFCSQSYSI